MPIEIVERQPRDIDSCVALAGVGREEDGYPHAVIEDLHFFFAVPSVGAWVAKRDGDVVGHVCIRDEPDAQVTRWACERLSCNAGDLVILSRLLVHPKLRGQGLAQKLLITATQLAHSLGKRPILDVSPEFTAAIRLYERNGWENLGPVDLTYGDSGTFRELVFVAPAA